MGLGEKIKISGFYFSRPNFMSRTWFMGNGYTILTTIMLSSYFFIWTENN